MSPFVQESIGFAGFLTNVAGNLLLTRKNKHGWWIRIVSNALWIAYAGKTASLPMTFNGITFFMINIYGWWEWHRATRAPLRTAHGNHQEDTQGQEDQQAGCSGAGDP